MVGSVVIPRRECRREAGTYIIFKYSYYDTYYLVYISIYIYYCFADRHIEDLSIGWVK